MSLLDSALEPIIERTLASDNPEKALLDLKIVDPACGSGHFLVAGAHRLAKRLATVRTGQPEPSPVEYRRALRNAISHCIYGVDVNPLAVELCKVALWMESLDPGYPLSFLDHHIKGGNSLLGTTPELTKGGIPDDAFKPIHGDDKEVAALVRKRNRQQRESRQSELFSAGLAKSDQWVHLASDFADVTELPENAPADVVEKAKFYEMLTKEPEYVRQKMTADLWLAAFVWPLTKGAEDTVPTDDLFWRFSRQTSELSDEAKAGLEELSEKFGFFHWHLEFPEVFDRWHGGFDCVLGNPPWERVKLQEKEWFARYNLQIANAPNAATRKKQIEALRVEDPSLDQRFQLALRQAEAESHLFRISGIYPLCGRGDINLYAVFAERMRYLLSVKGRLGCVLPTGIATDETTQFFFQDVIETKSLVSIFDFENRSGFFPAVDSRMKFSLFTCGGVAGETAPVAEFVFFAQTLGDLYEPQRRYALGRQDIQTLNPNTLTCPVFRTSTDAELSLAIHRRTPIFRREAPGLLDCPWMCDLERGFRQGEDEDTLKRLGFERNKLLFTADEIESKPGFVPLVEGKTFDMFDHRAASIFLSQNAIFRPRQPEDTSFERHQDPYFTAIPFFWVQSDVADAKFPWTWFVAHKKVTSATNERTMVATILSHCAVNDTVHVFTPSSRTPIDMLPLFCANLCSFCLDYLGRQKLGGNAYSMFVVKQLPILPPATYDQYCPWSGAGSTVRDWLLPRILELVYSAWDLESFARDCGYDGPPFRWDKERRFLLRCELDAAFFQLYLGAEDEWRNQPKSLTNSVSTPRDAVDYVMGTFPIVKRKDEDNYGEYRTKRVVIEIYDEMSEAITTGEGYRTRLDPAPGAPTDEGGKSLPVWEKGQVRPRGWPEHIHPPRGCECVS